MKRLLMLLTLMLSAGQANAGDYAWADMSLNYLAWTPRTLSRTATAPFGQKKSFPYVEVEGGRAGDWGDLYGFFDVENPTRAADNKQDPLHDRRTAAKVVARFKLVNIGPVELMAYAHLYDFVDHGFGDQNRVLGLGADIRRGPLVLKPFVGMHHEVNTGVGAWSNGGMTGYVLLLPFKVRHQHLMLSQWHETEFAREERFLALALEDESKGKKAYQTGHNGAVMLAWTIVKEVAVGVSYRYAFNKLGVAGVEDGLIYTLRAGF